MEIIPLTSVGLVSVSDEVIIGNDCVCTAAEMQTERDTKLGSFWSETGKLDTFHKLIKMSLF